MFVWTLLLLLSEPVVCLSVPAPLNVSIWSFNMEHILRFLPGPGTPDSARFTVEALTFRRSTWRAVPRCSQLMPGQGCNLTRVFKDPLDLYQARVRAFSLKQSSNWTESARFHPLTDTVLGPPVVSLSGCGNCLKLRVTPPHLKTDQPLELFRKIHVQVERSMDGAQFNLTLSLEPENRIEYLQQGVEYCVTVTVSTLFNDNSTPSKRLCALTSPPAPVPVHLIFGLVALSVLLLFLLGCLVCCTHLGSRALRHCVQTPVCFCWGCGSCSPGL